MRQGERQSSKLTDVVCKRRGCRNRLTVIALDQSPRDQRYCSRQCAGFGGAAKSRKGVPRDEPVQHDADLEPHNADLDSEAPPHLPNEAKPGDWGSADGGRTLEAIRASSSTG